MSKSDAMRAMREAKYARTSVSAPSRRETPAAEAASAAATPGAAVSPGGVTTPPRARQARAKAAPSEKAVLAPAPPTAAAAPEEERCGHKSMNGRACTRESGHPEKSHRYS
ncbi:MAG: hypothetical protein WKF57_10635 [Nakamurella sp.]